MAAASSLMAEENFLCSICLEVFNNPVSIPCGHNFCLDCITEHWQTNNVVLSCPLCKEEFHIRPKLRVNTLIAQMAAGVKQHAENKNLRPSEEAGDGNVLCDICTKLTAVKSCLVCFVSYCEEHLEPHQRISALKKHKLIHAVKNPESRVCRIHHQPLELFCRPDQMFVCESCKDRDHKTHTTVSLAEEAKMRRAQLGKEEKDMDEMIQTRQQKIYEIQHSVEASRTNAAKVQSYSIHVMANVVDYIKRSQAELAVVIQTQQKKKEAECEGFTEELREEIMHIKQKNMQLNQVSLDDDDFRFLKNFLSLTITPPQVKDWSDVTFNSHQCTTQEALTRLQTTVTKEIRMLCDPELKEMQQFPVDVILDPNTAHPSLNVSVDGKQVTCDNRKRNLPDKPQRFDHVLNVLAKEGFSSGKFYYEVQVKHKTQWDLGVTNESINRKGDLRLSPKIGYWTISLRNVNKFTANESPVINLHVRDMPQKVGVFTDYEEGQVSFFDVDSRACIFSFTGCNFTEKLFPFFSPSSIDGGRNSAPLIITSVNDSR